MKKTNEPGSISGESKGPVTRYELPGGVETTLRTGPALHPSETAPESIEINGTLSAPFNFLVGKPTLAAKVEDIHMLIDNDKGTITLNILDTDPFTTHTITGKLSPNAELAKFHINGDKKWAPRELTKFIRQMKVWFATKSDADALVSSLTSWEAKVETTIKDQSDRQGNTTLQLEQKVGTIPLKNKFVLRIPLFKGYKAEDFEVEIGFDATINGVTLYLFSDSLYELDALKRLEIMADEQAKFDKYAFSKVVIS